MAASGYSHFMTSRNHQALIVTLANRLGPAGLRTEPDDLAPWLTDWRGRYHGSALALASPASVDEVQAVVDAARAAGVAIVPQGGNTSMVGGATPPAEGMAILLSLRRMNRIRAVSALDNAAEVEAGVVLADLHDAAAAIDRQFPLSLAAKGSATVGGLVSTNAGGTQVLRYGPMRSLVLGLEAVLPDGGLFRSLAPLRKDNRGYDLKHLLIGAEGTLGVVTAATLRLVPAPATVVTAWIGLAAIDAALPLLRALETATGDQVSSFELVPAEGLHLVLRHIPGTRAPLAGAHPWHVLVEIDSSRADPGLESAVEAALAAAMEAGGLADAVVARGAAQRQALWHLRESMSEAERIDGAAAKHDIAVPVADMPGFITRTAPLVEARFPGARVLAFGHLGDGNVHFNVRAPEGAAPDWLAANMTTINRFVHGAVTDAGGTLSAEHGIGQAKRDDFWALGDPVRLAAMLAIKRALDPDGLFNPGKLLPPACA